MNTENEYEQEPEQEPSENPASEPFWTILANTRAAKGLSAEEVARYLKITESYVLALEQGRYDELPGLAFVRGYIKNYARLLGLESEPLLQKLAADVGDDSPQKSFMDIAEKPLLERHTSPLLRYSVTLLCAVIIAFGSYYVWNTQKASTVMVDTQQETTIDELAPAVVEISTPAASLDSHAVANQPVVEEVVDREGVNSEERSLLSDAEPAAGSVDISLVQPPEMASLYIRFRDDCWMEVQDMAGNVLMSGVEKAGTELDTTVPSAVRLRLGNAPGVDEIKFAGRSIVMPTGEKAKKVAKLTLSTSEQS